jgi:hypothetical protein
MNEETITEEEIKILDELLEKKIESDEDLIALGEVFDEDE